MLGIPLGLLIGIVSSAAFLFLVRTAWRSPSKDPKTIVSLVGELLALPTFWFGGPWLTTALLENIQLSSILPYYLVSLTCTFAVPAVIVLIRLVIQIGNEIGGHAGGSAG